MKNSPFNLDIADLRLKSESQTNRIEGLLREINEYSLKTESDYYNERYYDNCILGRQSEGSFDCYHQSLNSVIIDLKRELRIERKKLTNINTTLKQTIQKHNNYLNCI